MSSVDWKEAEDEDLSFIEAHDTNHLTAEQVSEAAEDPEFDFDDENDPDLEEDEDDEDNAEEDENEAA